MLSFKNSTVRNDVEIQERITDVEIAKFTKTDGTKEENQELGDILRMQLELSKLYTNSVTTL